jgi:DNA-directed RNA polymerase subunit N (RpoN/RPB10)
LGLNRYCCRRNLISNVDMMKIIWVRIYIYII